ncbi:hypothetical protein DFQ28_004716, partial [Apophysomyces sp. BC1034]
MDLIDISEPKDYNNNVDLQSDVNHIEQLNQIKETNLPLYDIVSLDDGQVLHALLNTGTSAIYVSPNYAKEVETAGSHCLGINSQVSLSLDAGGFQHMIDAYMFNMKFDLILGRCHIS